RDQIGQEGPAFALQLGRQRVLGERVAEDLDPGPEDRRAPALEAPAARDGELVATGDPGEFADAARLSDARLAHQEAEASPPVAGSVERAEEPLHGLGPSDERVHRLERDRRLGRDDVEAEDL